MRGFVLPTKIFFVISFLILYSILSQNIFAQLANFDSLVTFASSSEYDFKNPVFDGRRTFGPSSISTWLVYEKHKSNGGSDIICRKAAFSGYETELAITNSITEKNINPAIYDNFLLWQTNKNGNWDLVYSVYDGTNWSAPQNYSGNTLQNEQQACVLNLSNFILIAFNRGTDIILSKYIKTIQQWEVPEFNVTDTVSASCYYPVLESGGSPYTIAFHKMTSPVFSKIRIHNFNTSVAAGYQWQNAYEIDLATTPHKIRPSFSVYSYPYYLINYNSSVIPVTSNGNFESGITPFIQGENSFGKGVFMPFIVDDLSLSYFNAFGCITKRNDSTFISLCRRYVVSQNNTQLKQKYIGSSEVTPKFDLSAPLFTGATYKMRALWEQTVNGKSALIESWAVDVINNISPVNENIYYTLHQNYPNPFNPSTRINYELRNSNYVTLKVFDLLGKEVAPLVNEKQNPGSYAVDFNATEFNLPSGIYFYTLNAGEFKETRKMVLVK